MSTKKYRLPQNLISIPSLTKITAGDLNKEVDDQEDKALFAKILRCIPNPRAVVDISYNFLGGRLRFKKKRQCASASTAGKQRR